MNSMQRTQGRNVFLWALYDFANSFTQITFLLYFAQWVVIEQGIADLYFNLVFVGAAVLLLLTAPVVGALLDTRFRRITGLRITTTAMALLYGTTALLALQGLPVAALGVYVFGFYAFLVSFTFYTPLLFDLAPAEKRGRVSGIGIMANYAGQITALIAALPFATGSIALFGGSPRAETLLPAVAWFVLLALPMVLWFTESTKTTSKSFNLGTLWQETRSLMLVPGITFFFLAYFLANDAVLTISANFSIFLEMVWGVSDTTKTLVLIGILVASAIGGLCSGILADRFGHKRTFAAVLVGWLVLLPLSGIVTHFGVYSVIVIFIGFLLGAHFAVARSVMAYLAPVAQRNLAFAYFGLMERASSFVGPLVWGLTVGGLLSVGADRYRIAVVLLALFVLVALGVLGRVRSDTTPPSS